MAARVVVAAAAEVAEAAEANFGDSMNDRVGIAWRSELSAGILANLDRVDVVEVISDDFFDASAAERRSLKTLAAQVPVALHGVSLGLASSAPADRGRLEKTARLVEEIQPQYWSEHLAFVRAGGIEIGHLAAPPRTQHTIDCTAQNIEVAERIVGTAPLMENVATLIDPPASSHSEMDWTRSIIDASGCDLLLDLHNLYANAINFNFGAVDFIRALPPERIAAVHLAGGRWIGPAGTRRVLDDHLHDIPDAVFKLLVEAATQANRDLTVILERDGRYPAIEMLLDELDRARMALSEGRRLKRSAAIVAAIVA